MLGQLESKLRNPLSNECLIRELPLSEFRKVGEHLKARLNELS